MTSISTGWKSFCALCLTIILVACGGGDAPAPEEATGLTPGEVVERPRAEAQAAARRERQRERAIAAAEEGFTFFRYRIDVSEELPKACFVFSSALDPDVDYAPYLEFSPTFRPALAIDGRELCVGGLSFGEDRTATLLEGLPAADGRKLVEAESVPISFEDRPPYVGFKGAGVILPRLEADGLPIETVNVEEVRISVSRISDRALAFKSVGQGQTRDQGRYGYLYGDENPRDVAEEIWTGTMAVNTARNQPVVTVFPLADTVGELEPGAYFVSVEDAKDLPNGEGPPASSVRWIMMTDLALTAYRGGHGLDLTLRSLQTGEAISAARVELVARNNSILAEARTGQDGRVQFAAPLLAGSGNTTPHRVFAYGEAGDLAVLELDRAPVDLASEDTGGRYTPGDVDGYVYTDRGIYRPGERVELGMLLRARSGEAIADRPGNLVIYRPNGLEAARMRFTETSAGGGVFDYPIPRGASRGAWRAALEMDGLGTVGSAEFSVEDFVPQRIAVELETDEDRPLTAGQTRTVEIDSRFLYGAPAAGLVVQSQFRVEPDPNPFKGYAGFRFGQHDQAFRERVVQLPETVTDGEGQAALRLDPRGAGRDAGRPLRLNAVVSVLEPGGRAVSESVRLPYRPDDLYLGIRTGFGDRAREGQPNSVEIAAFEATGDAVSRRVKWSVVAIDYHYDWYQDGGEWRWRRSRTVSTVNEGWVTTPAGGAHTLTLDNLDWGNHEIILTDNQGRRTTRSFWVGWGGGVTDDGVEAPDRVVVRGPDNAPRAGGETEIAILPPYDGEAQIVVATDRVLSVLTRPVSREGTRVTLPVTENWGEGAYVMVNVYTPRDPSINAKPRRAVGVAHVPVDVSRRTFDLTINTSDDVLRPGREHRITVDIEGGPREPVFLTLAAVDEGILQLTKFNSPNPVDYFFGKKALGVELLDDYGRLLDPNLGFPAEIRTGGDQLGGEGLSVVPTKSLVLFSGLVEVGRSRKASIRFDVPEFNGELRLMAVAWSESGLGAAARPVTVRDPVAVDLILPRFLAPGDEAIVTASIDNVEGADGSYEASLKALGVVGAPAGDFARNLAVGQRADGAIPVEAEGTGISDLTLSVMGPTGFEVDRDYQIETRTAFLPVSIVDRSLMQPGETLTLSADRLSSFVPGTGEVTVSFSRLPVNAVDLHASLARYPYGCTEQTVSRAMPLLYSDQLVAEAPDLDGDEISRTRMQESIDRILARQSADGAFGLWREGDRYASPWLGAYTTDFLARAKEEGYVVPDEALRRAYASMRTVAQGTVWRIYGYDTDVWESRWHTDTTDRLLSRSSAYALYVLARAGEADVSRLRYLHDSGLRAIESPLARAHLAAGLAHMGDRSRARSAFDAALEVMGYNNSGDYYQTPLRDLAAILAVAAETGFTDVVETLAVRLAEEAPDPERLTTQEKAQLLLALNGLSGGEEAVAVDVEGLGSGNDNDRRYVLAGDALDQQVSFTLGGEAPLFRTVIARGDPASAPPVASEKLRLSKSVRTLTGGRVNLSDMRQGDQVVVTITLSPEEARKNPMIVADLLPAGFEIETVLRPADGEVRGGDSGAFSWVGEIARAQTAQAQDDRYVAAIDVFDEPVTLAYLARAVTPGDFVIPGAVAEDMYRRDVFARSAAGRVQIGARTGSPGGTP